MIPWEIEKKAAPRTGDDKREERKVAPNQPPAGREHSALMIRQVSDLPGAGRHNEVCISGVAPLHMPQSFDVHLSGAEVLHRQAGLWLFKWYQQTLGERAKDSGTARPPVVATGYFCAIWK